MIRVFGATDTTFTSNGDVVLRPLKAKVHKKDNGDYYLDLDAGLEYIDHLIEGNIIVANTPTGDQAFRVGNVTKTKNKISSKCFHVFYDSKNYLIAEADVENKNCNDALVQLNVSTEPWSEFSVFSDIATENSYQCIRKSLYDALRDVVSLWGGHLVRNNFNISVVSEIGTDNGIVVQYKKNLKEITCHENWNAVCTKLLPIGRDGIKLNALDPSKSIYVVSSTQYDLPYCKTVTFTQDNINKEDYPTENDYLQALVSDLEQQAEDYLETNCVPQVNYTLKANLDKLTDIGDTVEVIDERLGVHLMTHVIGFVYDCIFEQYSEVEFGNFTETISGLVGNMTQTAEKVAETASLEMQDKIFMTIEDYIGSKGVTDGWTWQKYASGVCVAWKEVSINSASISWSTFLTSLYCGIGSVTLPFEITDAVIEASINNCTDVGWVAKAVQTSTTSLGLTIVREGNTGTMTVNVCVRGKIS